MLRLARFSALAPVLALLACAADDPLEEDLPPMGNFRLAHNIVVADNMQQVPPSRNATPEEWESILEAEIYRRFSGYEGDRLYHIGIAVDGYSLAPPGIPIVLSPRSVLILSVNIWDDALGGKLHEEPEQIIVFEGTSAETFLLGSGIARNRNEQMQILARNAARRVQLFMLQNPEWFNISDEDAVEALNSVEALAEAAEETAALEPAIEEAETDGVAQDLVLEETAEQSIAQETVTDEAASETE